MSELKTGLQQSQCIELVGEALLNMQANRPVTREQYQMLYYLLHPILEGLHPNKIPGGRREGRPRKKFPDALAMSVQGRRKKTTKDKATADVSRATGVTEDAVRGRYERSDPKSLESYAKTARRLTAKVRLHQRQKNSR